eukprot:1097327-Rhodomonas_salina.1
MQVQDGGYAAMLQPDSPRHCPVLMLSAMPGTDVGYAATMLLCDVRYHAAIQCPVLTSAMLLQRWESKRRQPSSRQRSTTSPFRPTDLLCGVRRLDSAERREVVIVLRRCYVVSGTDIANAAALMLRRQSVVPGIVLRAGYAVSGTDVAHVAVASCPIGTDMAYLAVASYRIVLRTRYATSGTDIGAAIRRVTGFSPRNLEERLKVGVKRSPVAVTKRASVAAQTAQERGGRSRAFTQHQVLSSGISDLRCP